MLIDIVIPCYNQYTQLKITIEAYAKQKTNHEFRLIIIDDGSTDALSYDINKLCKSLQYLYITQKNSGRSAARNTGIKNLKGDYVIFNDSDRPPAPDFIEQHMSALLIANNIISIGTPKEIYLSSIDQNKINDVIQGRNTHSRLYRYAKKIDLLFSEDGSTKSELAWLSTYSGNIGMSTANVQNELFDEHFSSWGLENLEWGYRLHNNGFIFHRTYDAFNFHIAHSRNSKFYIDNFKMNHQYFLEKHFTLAVSLLYEFMIGLISLQEFELRVSNLTCIPFDKPDIYFEIGGVF